MSKTQNDKLTVLLKQYELLSSYSIKTMPNIKNTILSFGLAFIGAIITGNVLLLINNNEALSAIIFLLVIPTLLICVFLLWLGEIDRMIRAERYLILLEKRINLEVGEDMCFWEQYVRKPTNRIRYPDVAVCFLFLGGSTISPLFGIFILRDILCVWLLVSIFIADILINSLLAFVIKKKIVVKFYSIPEK